MEMLQITKTKQSLRVINQMQCVSPIRMLYKDICNNGNTGHEVGVDGRGIGYTVKRLLGKSYDVWDLL